MSKVKVLAALEVLKDYFQDRADVVDGDYGQPEANEEMRMGQELEEVLSEVRRLRSQVAALEQLRLHWAQGHSSDSSAAQALSQVWVVLGVENQTQCMMKLRELVRTAPIDPRLMVTERACNLCGTLLREGHDVLKRGG